MRIKAIFYDFDGVIKESTQIKTAAFYELYLPHGKHIAEKAVKHHIEHGGISRFEKFKYYHQTFLGIALSDDEIQTLAALFSKLVFKKIIDSAYVSGALESIKNLSHTFDQFIVTGTPQSEIEDILNALNIRQCFKGVYGSPTNKIDISSNILETYHLKSDQVVFIGDASTDYKAALHHNFHFILREHEENADLFKTVEVIKSKNLDNLETILTKLNQ